MVSIIKPVSSILLLTSLLFAEENSGIKLSGWGWLTMGQVKESEYTSAIQGNVDFDEKPLGDFQAGIKLTSPLLSRTTCKIHLMSSYTFPVVNTSMGVENAEPLQKSFSFSLLEASLETDWEIAGNDTIEAQFGYFPVKYNPEAMNLGEYLFRSNAYPPLLVSGFEIADKVKLAGMRTGYRNHASTGCYKADLFFNTEMDLYPTMDLSLSGLIGYTTPGTFLDFSAGISFYHLISFDEKRSTPAKGGSYTTQSASFVDSITGDTTDYTFRGAKTAARVTIDPKAFFHSGFLGKNDLKLYGETAILGIKDYPGWYDDIRERMPIMFGMNVPTHPVFSYGIAPVVGCFFLDGLSKRMKAGSVFAGIATAGLFTWLEMKTGIRMGLDVLSVEAEYYPMPYQNSFQYIWKSNSPVPYFNSYAGVDYYSDWNRKTDDNWKWSIYASKVIKNFKLSGQIASDHTSRSSYMVSGKKVYTEMCPRSGDWYYMLRCGFFF